MSITLAEVEEQARKLAPEDRARLAEALLESLQSAPLADLQAAWAREIEARVAAYEQGESEVFAAEEVFAEARRLAR